MGNRMATSAHQSGLPGELGALFGAVAHGAKFDAARSSPKRPVNVVFFIVMLGGWLAFDWAVVSSPGTLNTAWRTVRAMPALPAWLGSIATLPWMIGLAVWESGQRTTAVRTAVVALIAVGFIVASFNIAFVGGRQ
jgi:hypothetical protein